MKIHSFPMVAVSRATLLSTSLGLALVSHGAVTPITWSGTSSTDTTTWSDGTNWVGGTAPTNDIATDAAVFDLADFTGKQPNASTRSVAGLQIGSGSTTGTLTISGIQLTLGSSGIDMRANAGTTTIAAPVVLGANQTWANVSANDLTLTGALSGSSTVTKSGSGKVILTGASTRTGATTISGGIFQLGSTAANASLGSGTYDIASGTTLRLEFATTNNAVTNLGNLSWANFTGAGTLNIAANGIFDYINSPTALPAGFTGTLQIDGGRVPAANAVDGGLGGTSKIVVKNGGQFAPWDGGTYGQSFTIDGTGYGEAGLEAALRFSNSGKTTLLNGTVTLAGNATIGCGGGGLATIANPIGETTPSSLTIGTSTFLNGTVVFNGVNTYTGNTIVRNGVLSLNAAAPTVLGNLQMIGGDGTYLRTQQPNQFAPGVVANFTSGSGAWNRFEFFGKDQTFAGINTGTTTTQGGGIFQNSETNGAAGAVATLTLNGSGTYVFNGHIRDYGNPAAGTHPVSLIKNGSGTQTLVGNVVSYSGATSINSGTLELISTTNFKSPTTITSGTTLKLGNNADTGTPAGFTVALNSGGVITHDGQSASHFWVIGGAVTNTGTTTINETSATNTTGTNKSLFIDGGLKGTGTVTINATNPGNGVTFRNNNSTFTGNLIVNGIADATVNLGSGIGVGGCTTGLQNTDIQLNGTMELLNQGIGWAGSASGAFQMGALSGTGVMVGNFTSGGTTTVTLGNTNNSGSFSGVIANGTGNTVHLVKVGTGTQTLSGANTYTGNTTVNGGALAISGGSSLSDSGTLTLADLASVQVTLSSNETIGALAGGGTTGGNVNLQGNTLTLAGTANTTYGGVLSGTGGTLIKTGTGTLTLAGINTYTGPTDVNAGRLDLTGSIANSALAVADGAVIGGEGTVASMTLGTSVGTDVIAVPATAGALTTTGALSVTGTTLVDISGPVTTPAFKVLQFGSNANSFTNANFDLANASLYRPGYAFTVNANNVTLTMAKKTLEWTGSVDNFWENGDLLANNFRDTTTLAAEAFFNADDVVFGNLPASDPTITVTGTVLPSSVTFNSSLNYTLTDGGISGATGVTKNGSGTATLTGANSYSGTTTVNGGTLDWSWSGASPQTLGGAVTVNNGGTYSMSSMASLSGGITVNSGGTFTWNTTTRAVDQQVGGKINIGAITIQAGGTFNLSNTKTVAYGTQDTLFNNQVLIGSGTVNQTGGGVVDWWNGTDLSGFSGTYNVQNGIFSLQCSTAANATTTATVNLTAGTGFLDLRTSNFACDKLTGGGVVGASFSAAQTLTVGTNNGSSTFSGIIKDGGIATGSGVIGLTKTGTGTFALTGTNTNTGTTAVNGGTLALSGGSAIDDNAAVSLANTAGATLLLNANETIGSLAGGGATGGNVNLQGNTLTVGNASNTSYAGVISGSGGLTKVGAGTLTLTGANSYSGNTAVTSGTLSVSSASFNDASTVTVVTGAVLNLNTGTTDTVGTLILGPTTVPAGTYNSSHPTYGSFFTGTGSLVVGGNSYDSWASSKGLAGADASRTADPDQDGIANALEFVLGGEPNPANPGSNSRSLLPTAARSGGNLVFTFRRTDAANAVPGSTIVAEYSSTISSWTTAQHGTNGVTIAVTDDGFGAGVDKVVVSIPEALATGSKLFARLNATIP